MHYYTIEILILTLIKRLGNELLKGS